MELKLKKLSNIQHIHLTNDEKAALRARVAMVMSTPPAPVEPLLARGMQHGLRIALSSALFVLFVGGSISAVASNALPGDPLYAIKTKINEKVRYALLSTTEQKVALQKDLIEKRVGEIKTLADSKTLTKEKQAKAQKALDGNIEDLSKELGNLSDKSPNSALSVTADLEESLKAKKEAVALTLDPASAESTATLETIDGTLKKVSQTEVKIISKELDNIQAELNTTNTETNSSSVENDTAPQTTPGPTTYTTGTTTPPPSTPASP